jgi:hypothetical protein
VAQTANGWPTEDHQNSVRTVNWMRRVTAGVRFKADPRVMRVATSRAGLWQAHSGVPVMEKLRSFASGRASERLNLKQDKGVTVWRGETE